MSFPVIALVGARPTRRNVTAALERDSQGYHLCEFGPLVTLLQLQRCQPALLVITLDHAEGLLMDLMIQVRASMLLRNLPVLATVPQERGKLFTAAFEHGADMVLWMPRDEQMIEAQIQAMIAACDRLVRYLQAENQCPLQSQIARMPVADQVVLFYLAAGLSNQEIARRTNLSIRRIEQVVARVLSHLGLNSRTSVIHHLHQHDLLDRLRLPQIPPEGLKTKRGRPRTRQATGSQSKVVAFSARTAQETARAHTR